MCRPVPEGLGAQRLNDRRATSVAARGHMDDCSFAAPSSTQRPGALRRKGSFVNNIIYIIGLIVVIIAILSFFGLR